MILDGNEEVLDAQFETIENKPKRLPSPPAMNEGEREEFQKNLKDLVDLMQWMNGGVDKISPSAEITMANITKKLTSFVSYSITANLQRVRKLMEFIKNTEDDMFQTERLGIMDAKEKTYYYMLAKNALNEVLSLSRIYLKENKVDMPDFQADDSAKRVLEQLKTLPPDKLDALLTKLEKNEI